MPDTDFQSLPAGFKLDKYEILEVLGAGNFGITYKAVDQKLQRIVAIKEYLPTEFAVRGPDGSTVRTRNSQSTAGYDFCLRKFLDEARTLVQLARVPSIVDVIDHIELNNTAYIVMTYVEGQSLSEYVRTQGGQLQESQLRGEIFEPLLKALNEVHQAGIYHRDIKPSNIYITDQGQPVLLDFGAARNTVGEQSKSLAALTIGFAAVEQSQQDISQQGPWTDLYALGATMYCCMTSKMEPPIDAVQRMIRIASDESDPLPPVRELCKERYSDEFLDTIDWMLSIKPSDRPQNVQQIFDWWERRREGTVLTDRDEEPRAAVIRKQRAATPTVIAPAVKKMPVVSPKKHTSYWPWLIGLLVVAAVTAGGYRLYQSPGDLQEDALTPDEASSPESRVTPSPIEEDPDNAARDEQRVDTETPPTAGEVGDETAEAPGPATSIDAPATGPGDSDGKGATESLDTAIDTSAVDELLAEGADPDAQDSESNSTGDAGTSIAAETAPNTGTTLNDAASESVTGTTLAETPPSQDIESQLVESMGSDVSGDAASGADASGSDNELVAVLSEVPPAVENTVPAANGIFEQSNSGGTADVPEAASGSAQIIESTDNVEEFLAGLMGEASQDSTPSTATARPEPVAALSENADQTTIADHLLKAQEYMAVSGYLGPGDSNASSHYKQVLAIDPDNAEASRGLNRIAEIYADAAATMFRQGDVERSRIIVERGLRVLDTHSGLLKLQRQIRAQ